jgi:hypothetical protein
MKKILVLAVFALSLTGCFSFQIGPPMGSVVLGERTVDFKADHDVINVGTDEGLFRALYFIVEQSDIELFNLLIVYRSGEREMFDTRLIFREGSRSRMVDLRGGKRVIESVQFTYRTVGERQEGKARVVVYGVR